MPKTKRDKIISAIINGLFFLAALVCFICAYKGTHVLDSQFEAERWKGESDGSFCQLSCFMPADGKLTVKDIDSFRSKMMQKLEEASVDITGNKPFVDCWSCEDSTKVYGMYSGTASIIACGGNFFDFHPLRLVTGNYFSGDDLMQDNVLLDEDLAWLLFGGNDLEGQVVYIFNEPFRVAGVVTRESDQATDKAYSGGLGLFMSYDKYMDLVSSSAASEFDQGLSDGVQASNSGMRAYGITCYEVCMPDPVNGFAYGVMESDFPIGRGELVKNTGRFSLGSIASLTKDFSLRSIHDGAAFSYWENAARYAENKAAILLVVGCVFLFFPLIILLILTVRSMIFVNTKLREDILPSIQESAEESIRKQQRKHWEKKHGTKS
ncbi:MAG: ABC transporter permease [Eubacteriales bacterium]|nr:ABC transporter permease [Eubacteriales bacterium]